MPAYVTVYQKDIRTSGGYLASLSVVLPAVDKRYLRLTNSAFYTMGFSFSTIVKMCLLVAVLMMSSMVDHSYGDYSIFGQDNWMRDEPEDSPFDDTLHNVQRREASTNDAIFPCDQSAVDPSRTDDPPHESPEYRYHVDIYDNASAIICGATILNKDWLITSASCLKRLGDAKSVDLAYEYLKRPIIKQRVRILKLVYHHKYNASLGNANDLALIKVATPDTGRGIEFNNQIQPICISALECTPSQSHNYTITGGVKFNETHSTKKLYQVVMASKQTCISSGAQIADDQICAIKNASININSCEGFLGGPVIYKTGGFYKLAGIVSSCHRNNVVVIATTQILNCGTEIAG